METRLFEAGTVPEWATPAWYEGRDHAPHLDQDGHRERLDLAAAYAHDAIHRVWNDERNVDVLDLGAGDGGLLSLVRAKDARRLHDVLGYDLQPTNVAAAARRNVDVRLGDAFDQPWGWADIVLATEFLEHVLDPHAAVRRLAAGVGPQYVVASSPYTETAAEHYDFHLWAWDLDGYRALFEDNGWRVLAQDTAWICQVVLAERTT